MKGQIIKIDRSGYYVSSDYSIYVCKSRGVFRNKNIVPIVGDFCLFSKEKLVIEEILPRMNSFTRPKVSNITQAFVVTSLKSPDFSTRLLDQFLILLYIKKVTPIICITKKDLINETEFCSIKKVLDYYEKLGYLVIFNTEIEKIKELLINEVTVFTGQTGAGKSSLLNKIDSHLGLVVGEVSEALGRGKHTTREVSLYEICSGKVLDTPGFSLIEFQDLSIEDIKGAFFEFENFPCVYKDCSHTKEVECCVKKAVLEGKILKERYDDYLKFIGR
ncbi:MAG: ribosome small subunit-dependent GTPase A [Bacilli bacterium]|nr:ribosome small subunit-dependent GTPase A [Bacilli bacterium]